MSNSLVYPTPVPYEGPDEYDIMFVGEAPGGEEVGQGRPFIGRSGQLLRRYIQRQGCDIPIDEVKFANLCKYRPRKRNKFSTIRKTDELQEGLQNLRDEINRVKPNLVVALGGWPMYYLTGQCGTRKSGKKEIPIPGSGIGKYRGSLLPAKDEFSNVKVLCSYHPSFIERAWSWNPIFFKDLQRASEDRHFPELRYPEYEEHIDPPQDILDSLTQESFEAELVSVDIETFPDGRFSCVGWAYERPSGEKAGVCVTYKSADLWRFAQAMWESDAPKTFQYGTYDISFMDYFWQWKVGGYYDGVGHDTYVASANLLPDFPRGLDFLCSIHTRLPYYKEERKVWKEEGDMNILWRYNIKDTIGTYIIAKEQMRLLEELYG